ncbi:VOC family protein [Sphingomonas sp. H39-1-10]|uniref:VOC family protein n=1 Tax=Sphingomonas pollutisoli TaxID=3030829 RepID=UPI0023B9EE8F|nr:VOC family protein [Sphingomonas pollutisoli]MDF0489675.1 VOC family protein [Sphingomonas pollutisoli]
MPTPYGMPIWYELITGDAAVAKAFYSGIVGWTTSEFTSTGSTMPYTIWNADGVGVGGLVEMADAPGGPTWLAYFHVADVDAKVAANTAAGGKTHMGPLDLPDVGRIALIADPQGAPLYLMTPAPAMGDQDSTSFSPTLPMRCAWNELTTLDTSTALPFYGDLLGMASTEAMSMGPLGDYRFLDVGETRIGAMMNRAAPDQPVGWSFYFRVPDVDAAAEQVRAAGGTVLMAPMDVPGGERIVVVRDPTGASIGFVSGERQ